MIDTPPNVDIGEVSVVQYMHQETLHHVDDAYIERYRFKCNFETAQQLEIYYQVVWYFDDMFHALHLVKKGSAEEAVLKESELLKMGINVSRDEWYSLSPVFFTNRMHVVSS